MVLYGYIHFNCIHKTDDIYNDIAEDVETTFDTSNYELLHKKCSFPSRIFLVNLTTFTEKILNGKLHFFFFCSELDKPLPKEKKKK